MSKRGRISRRNRLGAAAVLAPQPPAAARTSEPTSWWARYPWLWPSLLAIACIALYLRSLPYPLAEFDDDVYLFQDPRLLHLSWRSLGQILVDHFFANFHPITTLTYALDTALWGTWLPGFRATHILLYAGGVIALYYLYKAILGDARWGFAAALLFAAHATHVEVVAWLAQRKDVVCLVFYAACLTAYIAYARAARHARILYLLALALGLLACLSKGYAVVLPAVLLAYDATLGGRVGRRQLLDKIPFVLVSLVVTKLTVAAQDDAHALLATSMPFSHRLGLLGEAFAAYVGKALMPVHLSSMYLVSTRSVNGAAAALGALLAVALVVGFFALRRRAPIVAFGFALFLLPLATVMNVFFTLRIWIADRYLFFPTIGACLIAAWAARAVHQRVRKPHQEGKRRALVAALAALVLLFAGLTVSRIGVWSSPIELWSDAIRKAVDLPGRGPVTAAHIESLPRRLRPSQNYLAVLATAYARKGDAAQAHALIAAIPTPEGNELSLASSALDTGDFDRAALLARRVAERDDSHGPEAWQTVARAEERRRDTAAARAAWERAIAAYARHRRSALPALMGLAKLELDKGRAAAAKQWAERAVEAAPATDPRPRLLLARTLEKTGELARALALCRELLALAGGPKLPVPFELAEVHLLASAVADRLGDKPAALAELEAVLALTREPSQKAELHVKLGLLAERMGDSKKAFASLTQALRLAPAHPDKANILVRLGVVAENLGKPKEASGYLEEVLRIAPAHPERVEIRLKIGQLAEKTGDREKAIRSYEEALALAPNYPDASAVRARVAVLRKEESGAR